MEVGGFRNLKKIEVRSSIDNYSVEFQEINSVIPKFDYFLVDSVLKNQIGLAAGQTVYVDVSEENKTLREVEKIILELNSKGMKKSHQLLVIGGGYVQDLATLSASLYMRGVKWGYAPSTLASMGDSCVGGKSSINSNGVKNLIGNFYPPSFIYIDVDLCKSLPRLEYVAGLSEIAKICFAKDFNTFDRVNRLIMDWEVFPSLELLSEVVWTSIVSKKYFIEEDEFDVGIRKLLNFGHSFGHALESSLEFQIPHGLAVLVGIVAASSHERAICGPATHRLVTFALNYLRESSEFIIPKLSNLNFETFSKNILLDKKNSAKGLVLVLPINDKLELVEISYQERGLELAVNAMTNAIRRILHEIR